MGLNKTLGGIVKRGIAIFVDQRWRSYTPRFFSISELELKIPLGGFAVIHFDAILRERQKNLLRCKATDSPC